jgi:curved DNA-binding protein CbpA
VGSDPHACDVSAEVGLPPVLENRRQRPQYDHSNSAMTEDPNPYAVLGVATVATPEEINYAFRVKVRLLHPDTRDNDAGSAVGESQLHQLIAAYHLLRDPEQRAEHDRSTAAQQQARTSPSPADGATASHQEPQTITVTHHPRRPSFAGYPLWAGPVRRHR